MTPWKVWGGLVLAVAVLLVLYPRRELRRPARDRSVVEIVYMGPGGPISGAMADAVREFERQSEVAHAADPSQPVYRVVSGQNAARNQVADPTRFLISVAGGTPPDVIWFDRYAVAEWAARGAFVPLDPFIARDLAAGRPDTPSAESFYASCWDEAKYNGLVYGIPTSVDDQALLYNRDLLRRAGLVDAEASPTATRLGRPPPAVQRPRSTGPAPDGDRLCPQFGNSWLYMFGWMTAGSSCRPTALHPQRPARRRALHTWWISMTPSAAAGRRCPPG